MVHKSKSEMKFERVMREFANGKLTSHGEKVTDISVARAIAFSEARKINPEYGMKSEGGKINLSWDLNSNGDLEAKSNNKTFTIIANEHIGSGNFNYNLLLNDQIIFTGNVQECKNKAKNIVNNSMKLSEGGKLDEIYRTGTAQQLWNAWDEKQRQHFLTDHLYMFRLELGDNPNEYIPKLAKEGWNMLPKEVRKEVVIHHAMGIYHEGAKIEEIEGDYEGGFSNGHIKLEIYKKDNKFSVYDSLNKNKLSPDYSDKQVARAFMQGIEQGLHSKITPEYVKGKFHLVKKDNSIILRSDRKEVVDAYILGFEVAKSGKVSEKNKMHNGGRITSAKKKLQDRIAVLKRTMVSANSTAQKSIQKKIDALQAKLDYNPSLKEKIAAQKGRFYLDVPTEYAKRIYRQLWRQGIKPRLHKLNGNTKVVVDHATKLDKAYKIYSDILKEKSMPVPALSKIKGKL